MSFPMLRWTPHRWFTVIMAAVAVAALARPIPFTLQAQQPPADNATPQFTILIFERTADLSRRTDPKRMDEYWSAYDDFAASLMQAGALRGGSALSETEAVVVRGKGGVDSSAGSARLGGYFVVAAPDLAAARVLASKAPSFAVTVEVRPHRENPHMAKMAPKPGATR